MSREALAKADKVGKQKVDGESAVPVQVKATATSGA